MLFPIYVRVRLMFTCLLLRTYICTTVLHNILRTWYKTTWFQVRCLCVDVYGLAVRPHVKTKLVSLEGAMLMKPKPNPNKKYWSNCLLTPCHR